MTQTITQFETESQMISAYAWNNILHEGVQNDHESECRFIKSDIIRHKSSIAMSMKYGIKTKAIVIEGFGFVAIS